MSNIFEKLNQSRKSDYYKNPRAEDFLEGFNDSLVDYEEELYTDADVRYPFIFTFGPPRSGTTLITQLLAHCFDIGYINNFIARFWKAPVCGIRLSDILFDDQNFSSFHSDYGSTDHLLDVHEFGYFWRAWLQKYSFDSIKNARKHETSIQWDKLRLILANIQLEFDKPVLFKNILGSYHLEKFKELLDQVIYVYIERDPLDAAVSILDARQKYYGDPRKWWSYVPPQIDKIIDEDYWTQIAGQVYYLRKFYDMELNRISNDHVVRITYKERCKHPDKILEKGNQRYSDLNDTPLTVRQDPPDSFEYRVYNDRDDEKQKFRTAFNRIQENDKDGTRQ
jgi:hypothetical protein